MAFACRKPSFLGELGLGFERDPIAGKSPPLRWRKTQNPREKSIFHAISSHGFLILGLYHNRGYVSRNNRRFSIELARNFSAAALSQLTMEKNCAIMKQKRCSQKTLN